MFDKTVFLASLCIFLTLYSTNVVKANEMEDIEPIEDINALDMNQNEKDKILACTEIVALKLKKDSKIIEDTIMMLNGKVQGELVNHKITGDILNKCYYSIDDTTVSTIFHNGQFMEPDFNNDLLNIAAVDYSTYKILTPGEFNVSPETQLLFMKIEKARNDFVVNNKQRIEQNRNDFKVFGYSLKEMPVGLNVALTIGILSLIMGGLLYLLKTVMANDKKAAGKKLEKNQKNK